VLLQERDELVGIVTGLVLVAGLEALARLHLDHAQISGKDDERRKSQPLRVTDAIERRLILVGLGVAQVNQDVIPVELGLERGVAGDERIQRPAPLSPHPADDHEDTLVRPHRLLGGLLELPDTVE
jgi:hypothetical protein